MKELKHGLRFTVISLGLVLPKKKVSRLESATILGIPLGQQFVTLA